MSNEPHEHYLKISPRDAINRLFRDFENFHTVAEETEDPESVRMVRAMDALAESFEIYDDVMFRTYGVDTPFEAYGSDDYDEEDEFDDDLVDEDDELMDEYEDDFEDELEDSDY